MIDLSKKKPEDEDTNGILKKNINLPENASASSDNKSEPKGKILEEERIEKKEEAPKEKGVEEKESDEAFKIPILKTFHHDIFQVSENKDDSELVGILAKELEDRKKAQAEYIQKTKELLKDSQILKAKQKELKSDRRSTAKTPEEKLEEENISDAISSAISYAGRGTEKKEDPTQYKPSKVTLTGGSFQSSSIPTNNEEEVVADAPEEKGVLSKLFSKSKKDNGKIEVKKITNDNTVIKSPVSEFNESTQTKNPILEEKIVTPSKQTQEKARIPTDSINVGGIREERREELTPFQKEQLKIKEEESVAREEAKNTWKEFEARKEELREKGSQIRDLRNFSGLTDNASKDYSHLKQGFLIFLIILGLLVGFGIIIYTIFFSPKSISEENLARVTSGSVGVKDVIIPTSNVFVDLGNSAENWNRRVTTNQYDGIIKFTPYTTINGNNGQLTLEEFFNSRKINLPQRLLTSFGNYYMLGKYKNNADDIEQKILIVSIRNYSDSYTLLVNQEVELFREFTKLYPNGLVDTTANNIDVQNLLIDNKEVRIVSNILNRKERLIFYFFNRNLLVFVVGNEKSVSRINEEIRKAGSI